MSGVAGARMNEPDVVLKVHKFLREGQGPWQHEVVRLYTDVHSSLLPYRALAPFQRFTLDVGDFVMHPDLVGQLSDGETIFALEAKGETELLKGLAQAEMYQTGFHYTLLAADAAALGESLIGFARRKNVGVLAVGDAVTVPYLPEARMPLRDTFRSIAHQMDSVVQVSRGQTFMFNIPTHYLAWPIALQPLTDYSMSQLPDTLGNYPMPKDWRSALRGAQKLGLVLVQGNVVQLTDVGAAVKALLPGSLAEWTRVHRKVGARGRGIPLAEYAPQSAAVLRLLLLRDPIVRLMVAGLRKFDHHSTTFDQLATACDQLDHARAPIFFLKPEAAARLMDERGHIRWQEVEGEDYRSSTFYQYKSILKHAGILKPERLGGATAMGYDPTNDVWSLSERSW